MAFTMMDYSQLVFKAAFEKLVPAIMETKEKDLTEEEFHNMLVPKTEAMAEAIIGTISDEDKASLMPEIYTSVSLPFLEKEGAIEEYIKKNKQAKFITNVLKVFTTTALLMAVGKIFEWGQNNSNLEEAVIDSASKEPKESVISE